MNGWRFAIFLSIVLSVWAVMHAYVFWRIASVPWLQSHVRDWTHREVIARLNGVCQSLVRRGAEKSEIDALSSSIHDLIRMWAA